MNKKLISNNISLGFSTKNTIDFSGYNSWFIMVNQKLVVMRNNFY